MGDIISRLSKESNSIKAEQEAAIDEIVSVFQDGINNGDFERGLEKKIGESRNALQQRVYCFSIEFWEYHDGCSPTYFSCGPLVWLNSENPDGYKSRVFKNTPLETVSALVVKQLTEAAIQKCKELGFQIINTEEGTTNKGYPRNYVIIGW